MFMQFFTAPLFISRDLLFVLIVVVGSLFVFAFCFLFVCFHCYMVDTLIRVLILIKVLAFACKLFCIHVRSILTTTS